MDKVVQQNAAAVQESSAAAEGMRQQAEALVRAVSAFRLSLEDRVDHAPADMRESAYEPTLAKPAVTRAASKAVAAPKQATPALAAGDDWEEF